MEGKIISQNKHAIAFLDSSPLIAGHTLVISKKHCSKLQELEHTELIYFFTLTSEITRAIEEGVKVNSTLLAIHNGKEAGQEIPHLHLHIVPRRNGDGGHSIHSCFSKNSQTINQERILEEIKNKIHLKK